MSNRPRQSAKNVTGDSDTFINFARRLMRVPHSEIKAELDAEKAAEERPKPFTRMTDASSRVPASSSSKKR